MDFTEVGCEMCSGFIWLRIVISGSYKRGNEPSRSVKGVEFTDRLSDYHLLKDRSIELLCNIWYAAHCFIFLFPFNFRVIFSITLAAVENLRNSGNTICTGIF